MSNPQVGPGVYQMAGQVFVVKENRQHTRCYAKKLVVIDNPRLTESGTTVDFDFEYAPGAIFDLRPEDKMPLDQAEALIIKYGRCIACGRTLKRAESVKKGIGPVCIQYFKSVVAQNA